jgi:hypothetical protein
MKKRRFLFSGFIFLDTEEKSILKLIDPESKERQISHSIFVKNFCSGFIEVDRGTDLEGVIIDCHGEYSFSGTIFDGRIVFSRKICFSGFKESEAVFNLKIFSEGEPEGEYFYFGSFETKNNEGIKDELNSGVAKFFLREINDDNFFLSHPPIIKEANSLVDGARL